MCFYGFKKIQNFAQNVLVLAYGFTEDCQFVVKTTETLYFCVVSPIFWIGST
jgi:hypothetical protein